MSHLILFQFFDKNGNPINGGCWHGKGCWFLHPGDPGWELPVQSNNNPSTSNPSNAQSVEMDIFGDVGGTRSKGTANSGWGAPRSRPKQRQPSGWASPPPASANNGLGWASPPPASVNNGSGWASPPPAPSNISSGWGDPPKDTTSGVAKQVGWATEWGQTQPQSTSGGWGSPPPAPADVRMEEADQIKPWASTTNDNGWSMPPSFPASVVSPASTSAQSSATLKSHQTTLSKASNEPPPLPYQAKLVPSSTELPDTSRYLPSY